ncbi:hypothetical protein QQX98_007991 [Neonectria punicea]|uniref:Uncharacterized protein n=1 Tax=Neonectria punicea TaxID=979145 RepID=A0ABR1GWC1_9HYPO
MKTTSNLADPNAPRLPSRNELQTGQQAEVRSIGSRERQVVKPLETVTIVNNVRAPHAAPLPPTTDNIDPFAFIYDDEKLPVRAVRAWEADVITYDRCSGTKWTLLTKQEESRRIFAYVEKVFYMRNGSLLSSAKED